MPGKYTGLQAQFLFTSGPAFVSAVLGSSVSVCLLVTRNMLRGLNHSSFSAMNPTNKEKPPRFGSYFLVDPVDVKYSCRNK
jgi:chemotaxis receptor (MCP) glutamine deamidase CheD